VPLWLNLPWKKAAIPVPSGEIWSALGGAAGFPLYSDDTNKLSFNESLETQNPEPVG